MSDLDDRDRIGKPGVEVLAASSSGRVADSPNPPRVRADAWITRDASDSRKGQVIDLTSLRKDANAIPLGVKVTAVLVDGDVDVDIYRHITRSLYIHAATCCPSVELFE